ncbi:Crp/Fnr family transcriptional regulator [Treponema primitia]|uniref:Crp/Fnr family transcriptional regulator n=1 Tax=Treponema primitia TaxID=88058 RepID=UPI000255572F|nr:helix-turn-helix domain-containing protein [Treponema primitia]
MLYLQLNCPLFEGIKSDELDTLIGCLGARKRKYKKNTALIQKLEHITQRTTREKLLSYLSSQAVRAKGNSFEIPFNRQELADYLSIDRSAMSSELGRMRDEGLIALHKNHFTVTSPLIYQ